MENLALVSSKFPVLVGAPNPSGIPNRPYPSLPLPAARGRGGTGGARRPRFVASAHWRGDDGASQRIPEAGYECIHKDIRTLPWGDKLPLTDFT